MKNIFLSSLALASVLTMQSCKTDFDNDIENIKVEAGTADFSKYVAVGNSLTSGYRDGALYVDGQNESFPSIIAQQMQLASGGEFKQPMMADNEGGIPSVGFGDKFQLVVLPNGNLAPYRDDANIAGTTTLANIYNQGPFNNMGVPGAKSFHLLAPGYGNPANLATGTANPYFVRFSSTPSTTVMQDVMAQNPTFFSLWIGNNDVLGYATSGGDGTNPITPLNMFSSAFAGITTMLTSNGAKGVVANIPDVTSIPFFTTVPYNPVPLDNSTANQINSGLTILKTILTALNQGDRLQTLTAGNNPLLIKDKNLTNLSTQITNILTAQGVPAQQATLLGSIYGQARHTTKNDLVLLTTASVIGTSPNPALDSTPYNKYGVTYPLEDKHVLTSAEVAQVLQATNQFNEVIETNAMDKGLAFVDMNAKMKVLSSNSGIKYDGVTYTTKFVTGGTFSLDGVHLTGRGYAVVANYFLEAINKKYNSTLPMVEANKYSGVKFP